MNSLVSVDVPKWRSVEHLVSDSVREPASRAIVRAFRQYDFERAEMEIYSGLRGKGGLRGSLERQESYFCFDPVEQICRLKLELDIYPEYIEMVKNSIKNLQGEIDCVNDEAERRPTAYDRDKDDIDNFICSRRKEILINGELHGLLQEMVDTVRLEIQTNESFFVGVAAAVKGIAEKNEIDLHGRLLGRRRLNRILSSHWDEIILGALPDKEDYISIYGIPIRRVDIFKRIAERADGVEPPSPEDETVLRSLMEYRLKEAERLYH